MLPRNTIAQLARPLPRLRIKAASVWRPIGTRFEPDSVLLLITVVLICILSYAIHTANLLLDVNFRCHEIISVFLLFFLGGGRRKHVIVREKYSSYTHTSVASVGNGSKTSISAL